jgi:hypothetical protein
VRLTVSRTSRWLACARPGICLATKRGRLVQLSTKPKSQGDNQRGSLCVSVRARGLIALLLPSYPRLPLHRRLRWITVTRPLLPFRAGIVHDQDRTRESRLSRAVPRRKFFPCQVEFIPCQVENNSLLIPCYGGQVFPANPEFIACSRGGERGFSAVATLCGFRMCCGERRSAMPSQFKNSMIFLF